VVRIRERVPTPSSSVVFTFGLAVESIKEFGGASCMVSPRYVLFHELFIPFFCDVNLPCLGLMNLGTWIVSRWVAQYLLIVIGQLASIFAKKNISSFNLGCSLNLNMFCLEFFFVVPCFAI
jgi:hypothetical protein